MAPAHSLSPDYGQDGGCGGLRPLEPLSGGEESLPRSPMHTLTDGGLSAHPDEPLHGTAWGSAHDGS